MTIQTLSSVMVGEEMKKGLIVLMLAMVLSGCTYTAKNITVQGWTKEGTSIRQTQLDYQSCSGEIYFKNGITQKQLEEDFSFCSQTSEDRDRHKETVGKSIGTAGIIPYAGMLAIIAGAVVRATGSLSVERCLESKGYKKILRTPLDEKECMESKGYEWK